VRAAHNLYRTDSAWRTRIGEAVTIRGIFDLAGSDSGEERGNVPDTKFVALLPMCDGDVLSDGMLVFDRAMNPFSSEGGLFKATYAVWGACHNAYNTEWATEIPQTGCVGPNHRPIFGPQKSAEQVQTGFQAMLAFFSGNVGTTTPSFNQWFDPRYPAVASPNIDRGYTPSPNSLYSRVLEEFWNPTGTSTFGVANTTSGVITVEHARVPQHDLSLRGARIYWWGAGESQFFQTNFGQDVDLSSFSYLDLRLARTDVTPTDDFIGSWLNLVEPTNFEVRLVKRDGTLSGPVEIASYLKLDGPVGIVAGGSTGSGFDVRPLLETARLPLSAFAGATLSAVRGVRLTFSKTPTGDIQVANIRATVP
jgi:hypothetical protein